MFLVFKMSFVEDIFAFFWLGNFLGYSLKKFGIFCSYHLVTLGMGETENFLNLESRISNLESRVSNLESRVSNLESRFFLFCSYLITNCVDFLCSVQKLSRLLEWNNSKRCFNNFMMLEYRLGKKISFWQHLTPKNLVLVSFNTKIYEFMISFRILTSEAILLCHS